MVDSPGKCRVIQYHTMYSPKAYHLGSMAKGKKSVQAGAVQSVAGAKAQTRKNRKAANKKSNGFSTNMALGATSIAPVAIDAVRPQVHTKNVSPTRKGASARLIGCDFVGALASATSLTVTTYGMNARNATTFPRLSVDADIYQRHRFNKLRLWVFGKSASTQSGTISAASLVYDRVGGASAPTTEADIKNYEGVAIAHPWSIAKHEVDCDAGGAAWYTDSTGNSAAFESMGNIYVVTPATTAAGDITFDVYIEYDVEFAVRTPASTVNLAVLEKGVERLSESDLRALAATVKLALLEKK